MKLTLRIWRQKGPRDKGGLVDYPVDISPDASFLEMLDLLNVLLVAEGEVPHAFDHHCR